MKPYLSKPYGIIVLALVIWALFGALTGYIHSMPGIMTSTQDAKDYVSGASYRLPTLFWLYNLLGPYGLLALHYLAYVLSITLLWKATQNLYATLIMALNLSFLALTYHALTEPLAILTVCMALYYHSKGHYAGISISVALLLTLRPLFPLPLASFREMAEINQTRFMAQVASCSHYFGSLGAILYSMRTNILNNTSAFSTLLPAWGKVIMLLYNTAIWGYLLTRLHTIKVLWIGILGYLILTSAITMNQGDRILIIAVPIILYALTKGTKS